jgi:hypothetical protein
MTHETPAPETPEISAETATTEASSPSGTGHLRSLRGRHGRRVLAVVAGVAMVPALYAAASAVTGGGERPSLSVASHGADDPAGTEIEVEHGVTTVKPDDDSTSPSIPTTPTLPDSDDDSTSPSTPTTPTLPDDDDDDDGAPAPAPAAPVTQTFTSVGGSVEVTLAGGALSLGPVAPATGYVAEIHDADSGRVEVRFFDADGKEWRIRVEVASGAMTQEITFHG